MYFPQRLNVFVVLSRGVERGVYLRRNLPHVYRPPMRCLSKNNRLVEWQILLCLHLEAPQPLYLRGKNACRFGKSIALPAQREAFL